MRERDRNLSRCPSDHHGSAAYLTDCNGAVIQTLNYLPYGEDWVEQNNFSPGESGEAGGSGQEKNKIRSNRYSPTNRLLYQAVRFLDNLGHPALPTLFN